MVSVGQSERLLDRTRDGVCTATVNAAVALYGFGMALRLRSLLATSAAKITWRPNRQHSGFDVLPTEQAGAWLTEIDFLQIGSSSDLAGSIFFEFNIPRMGRRIDVVLVIGPVIFAVEFKVGEKTFDRSAIDQVWDYGLDLKNFHEASHDASIVPILIATEASECPPPTGC